MKQIMMLFTLLLIVTAGFAQADKEQLALAISKADDANTEKLMQFIWKRKSDVAIDGEQSLPPSLNSVLMIRANFRQSWWMQKAA